LLVLPNKRCTEIHFKITLSIRKKMMKTWQCIVCGFVYEEVKGLPEDGIAPGTAWADVPENWECPDCGVSKSDFEMVQVG
jgi:rubredoxin